MPCNDSKRGQRSFQHHFRPQFQGEKTRVMVACS